MPGYQVPLTTVDANTTINNQKLVTTGLNVGKNYIINGAMEIDQRNTATTAVTVNFGLSYTVDRWFLYNPTATNITGQRVAGTNTGTKYALQINGAASFTGGNVGQRVENLHIYPLAGQTVTFSMKVYSTVAISNAQLYGISCSTPSDSSYDVVMFSQGVPINVGLNNLSVTATLPASLTNGGEFGLFTGTIGAGQYIQISAVQAELGSNVTPFARSGGGLANELVNCQRYYYRIYNPNGGQYNAFALTGINSATTTAFVQVNFPVKMRRSPTSIDYANSGWYVYRTGGNFQGGTWALNTSAAESACIIYTTTGLTINDGGIINQNVAGANTSYFGFTAEL